MTQAHASPGRTRVGLGPSAPTAPPATHPAGLKRQAVGRAGSLALAPTLSERRREENRRNFGLGADLRCECAVPSCRETLPAAADHHRGAADRYIVAPNHLNGGTAIRVADRFFVISNKEARGSG